MASLCCPLCSNVFLSPASTKASPSLDLSCAPVLRAAAQTPSRAQGVPQTADPWGGSEGWPPRSCPVASALSLRLCSSAVAMVGLTPCCGVTLGAVLTSPARSLVALAGPLWQAGRQSCLQAGAASPEPAVSQVLGRKKSGVRFRKDDFPFCVSSPLKQRLQGPPQPGSAELCSHTLCHPSDSRTQTLLAAVPFQAIFYLWHKSQLQRLKTGY